MIDQYSSYKVNEDHVGVFICVNFDVISVLAITLNGM